MRAQSPATRSGRTRRSEGAALWSALEGIAVFLAINAAVGILAYIQYAQSVRQAEEEIAEGLLRAGGAIKSFVDVDLHRSFRTPEDEHTPEYQAQIEPLWRVINAGIQVAYIYTVIRQDGKVYFVLDATPTGDADGDGVEDSVRVMEEYPIAPPEMLRAFDERRIIASGKPYTDKWGTFISGYFPLFDSTGNFEAVLGLDIEKSNYYRRLEPIKRSTLRTIAYGLLLSLIAGGLVARLRYLARRLSASSHRVRELNHELQDENRRIGSELAIARQMQQLVLPPDDELEAVPGLDIAGVMEPADEVGGDYYDVLLHRDGAVKVGIGDVCGHGLESGIVMIMTQAAVRMGMIAGIDDTEHLYASINSLIFKNLSRMGSRSNLTLSLLDFYPDGRGIVVGQHEEFMIRRKDGSIERIDTSDLGIPVGLDENIADLLGTVTFELLPGEAMLMFSDGVTEAENTRGKLFGFNRLMEAFAASPAESARATVEYVMKRVKDFIDENSVLDDMAVVVVQRVDLQDAGHDDTTPIWDRPSVVVSWRDHSGKPVKRRMTSRFTIGRDGDIQVLDDLVSRHHVEVFFQNGIWLVRDLRSVNGTFLNGAEISEAELPQESSLTCHRHGQALFLRVEPPDGAP